MTIGQRTSRGLLSLVLILIGGALLLGYWLTATPVTLTVDGHTRHLRTHQRTVAAFLLDSGLTLRPEDRVTPPLDTPLRPHPAVNIERAYPVIVVADGHTVLHYTHAASVAEILTEVRLSLTPQDEVEIVGTLPVGERGAGHAAANRPAGRASPPRIIVHRAVPLTIHDGDQEIVLRTTAPTVGEALRRAGVVLYLADGVRPALRERVTDGMDVYIDRSTPVVIQVDGRTLRARTHRQRVGEVLADLGIVLTGQDYTSPTLTAPLGEGGTIRVVRVTEQFIVEQEPIPFDTVWAPDPDLEIDHQRVMQEGTRGVLERRLRVRYEDGHEVSRTLDSSYVALPPSNKVLGYGTKIVIRTLDTPSGPVEYWRVIRMRATSYSASTAGTPRSSPWYGRTATGMRMGYGIVAVDPRVINLGSRVYVPGYGIGVAGDTGGAVRGHRIDLGYDDDNLVLWHSWVDVYLLTPVPSNINYIID